MGRTCHLCRCERPNEQFGGGRGLRARVCKRCRRKGKTSVRRELTRDWLIGLRFQKNISEKNRDELRRLSAGDDVELAREARFVLRIATVAPRRRRRYRRLAERAPELIKVAAEGGWIHPDAWWWYQAERLDPAESDPVDEPDISDEATPSADGGFRDHIEEFWFWWEHVRDG